jgi:hypothetical protein
VVAQTINHFVFVAFFDFLLHFLQGEVHHVMVVQFFARQGFAEAQP